jgi:hypothetical protein
MTSAVETVSLKPKHQSAANLKIDVVMNDMEAQLVSPTTCKARPADAPTQNNGQASASKSMTPAE